MTAPWGGDPKRARTRRADQLPPPPQKKGCNCPMMAAVRSVKRGQYRLARRYARLSVRLIVTRAVA